jgi:NitT/TauT family transport system substrate-binding protein
MTKRPFASKLFVHLGALLGLAGLALTPGTASAQAPACAKIDTVKVQEYPGLIQNLVAWSALDQGFFRKHCLDARMTSFPSGPAALAASLQGGLDFISLAPDTVYVPVSQGFNLKIVAFMNDTVHYALVAGKHVQLPPESEGFKATMKALYGKKIGVNALGSTTDILAKSNFTAAGLDFTQVNWIAYGPPTAAIAALQNGSLDAAMFFGDGMDIAAAATGGTIAADLRDPNVKASPLMTSMKGSALLWAAQGAFVQANQDVVRRFAQANNEAVAWIKEPKNREGVLRIVRERAPSPPGVGDAEALLQLRAKNYIPQVNARASMRSLKAWSEWDVMMKRIPKPADVDGLLWETAREMLVP